ncbi:MAG TPA: class I SAM-dependent methyltransferase [Patescibacteria group bacterium]|nr:class I SAM-dependent methyltransferase [Patescibacteria group bacterium]
MPGVIIDIGTGDGKFAYELAKEHPDRFVIGIDPNHQALEEVSNKIYKKPVKGGLPNALFVLANIEDLPEELSGIANQIFINFPWSGLLKGLILVEEKTWLNLKRICQPGAYIDLVFGYDENAEKNKVESLNLPTLSEEYLQNTLVSKVDTLGFKLVELNRLTEEDLKNYPSTWAKKLAFGKDRKYFHLQFQVS